MIKRDEEKRADSCFNRALPDEWMFVLLGRDAAAPAAIRAWCVERVNLGRNHPGDAQILEALSVANNMEASRRDGGG